MLSVFTDIRRGMQAIIGYIRQYLEKANFRVHLFTVLALAALVAANYVFGINRSLYQFDFIGRLIGWYFLLLAGFSFPYILYHYLQPHAFEWRSKLLILIFVAPAIFAWKMTAGIPALSGFTDAGFWNQVLYFPAKVVGTCIMLFAVTKWLRPDETWMGLRAPISSMKPYVWMLVLMVPLIALAATQPDFRAVYPKAYHVIGNNGSIPLLKLLAFEAAYGSDFFTIELFFRGFLVIYCSRWAGRYAILPMAVFYCIIHFGKPLGECISSFFGGMLLGIISYRTQSIWGGLLVHLGIAWLMELMPVLIKV